MNNVFDNLASMKLSNVGRYFLDNTRVYACSPNLYDVTIGGFLNINSFDSSQWGGDFSIIESLYTELGSSALVMGTVYKDKMGLSLGSQVLLTQEFSTKPYPTVVRSRLQPLAFLDSSPVFKFSKFPSILSQDSIVSFPTYVRLSQGKLKSVSEVPLKHFLIQMNPDLTDDGKDQLKVVLQKAILEQSSSELEVWDYRDAIKPAQQANVVVGFFFNFTTVIAMLISFFSLMSSMYSNIYEQTKEIGVLRAIGIKKIWMYRIYIYEAFILVLASSILGMIIGAVVGFTMTIQRVLFTQLPIPFTFPWQLMIVVFLGSIVFAVLASWGPTRQVLNKPIVQIMRLLT